jgi:hypothetical protein
MYFKKEKKNHFDDESIVFDEKMWMIHLRGVVRGEGPRAQLGHFTFTKTVTEPNFITSIEYKNCFARKISMFCNEH